MSVAHLRVVFGEIPARSFALFRQMALNSESPLSARGSGPEVACDRFLSSRPFLSRVLRIAEVDDCDDVRQVSLSVTHAFGSCLSSQRLMRGPEVNLCVSSREFCRLSFLSVRYSAFGVVLCRLQVHSMVGRRSRPGVGRGPSWHHAQVVPRYWPHSLWCTSSCGFSS